MFDAATALALARAQPGLVYEVEGCTLGRGTYGDVRPGVVVYGRKKYDVAVKHMRGSLSSDDAILAFLREVVVTMWLGGTAGVPMRDALFVGDHACLVLDRMSETLQRGVAKAAPEDAVGLAFQLLMRLDEAHGAGVVHRDLKPGNILVRQGVCGGGECFIGDWGSACLAHERNDEMLTTLWYRAPEVILSLPHASSLPAADLWSMGCVLVELFAGAPLMPARNEDELLFMHAAFARCGGLAALPTRREVRRARRAYLAALNAAVARVGTDRAREYGERLASIARGDARHEGDVKAFVAHLAGLRAALAAAHPHALELVGALLALNRVARVPAGRAARASMFAQCWSGRARSPAVAALVDEARCGLRGARQAAVRAEVERTLHALVRAPCFAQPSTAAATADAVMLAVATVDNVSMVLSASRSSPPRRSPSVGSVASDPS